MTKAIFFDIFGTLVDWRTSLIKNISKSAVLDKDDSFIELLVINWRLEYQPILNKVNDKKIPWMILDDLHLISLKNVLKKMHIYHLTENQKKELVFLWHKLEPWKDTVKGLNDLGRRYITCSLSNGNINLQKNLFRYAHLNFNFIFSAENFKKYKPDTSVYLGAANNLGLDPTVCFLLASHKNDLVAADKAGFKTIFIRRDSEYGNYSEKFKEQSFDANLSIGSLEDLDEVVI
ncbi:MAG: haloacid dehalogenase type II [Pelagibacterales bacterium]|nr:haloacid dehalogenase type II [Pelagibacterales bacterium]|tara:strand:- start:456 stop:1154 length:699 start_codon:yes stop_codon:yes gene_type:complete